MSKKKTMVVKVTETKPKKRYVKVKVTKQKKNQ